MSFFEKIAALFKSESDFIHDLKMKFGEESVAPILETIPATIAMMTKTADISMRYQPCIKTPYNITPRPPMKMVITSQLFAEIEY